MGAGRACPRPGPPLLLLLAAALSLAGAGGSPAAAGTGQAQAGDEYLIGVGIADITGPAADINLMGYAKPNQDAGGVHLRQFSRALIVEDQQSGDRVLYISIDNGMISQLLRSRVLDRLAGQFGPAKFNASNVMMTATHSHSCPGGFFQYMLYNIPSAGFIGQTLEALVEGVARSVARAHADLEPGRMWLASGELLDASINRSPTAYANNPAEERARYAHDTDKTMHLLRLVDARGQPKALVNWFAVHGTSMNNTNHLISSDNKGYAALLAEQHFNPPRTLPGRGKFVAIFAQANEGDVSPNTSGPRCVDSGLPCDPATSTCGSPPRNEKCIAAGPGKDMFESTKIIAYKQFYLARELFLNETLQRPVRGPVRFMHEHIDITKQEVPLYESIVELARRQRQAKVAPLIPVNKTYHTCNAGLGYSFAAGTIDGPGAFDFTQGDTVSGRYWNMVRDFLKRPSPDQILCHKPKPILLSTGEMDFPYTWHPRIVPTQILAVGQLAIVGLPGEFTTMAGRRVREAVAEALAGRAHDSPDEDGSGAGDDPEAGDEADGDLAARGAPAATSASFAQATRGEPAVVVLSGLSNIYSSYITTVEEYEVQRYEGASTLYGPHTLQAYVNQFRRLAGRLAQARPQQPSGGPEPPDLSRSLFTLKPGVIFDGAPHGTRFGQATRDVEPGRVYKCLEQVSVAFVAGNPRNDLRQEDSYLYVERLEEAPAAAGSGGGANSSSGGSSYDPDRELWRTVATDASWETKFIWERTNTLFGESRATIQWDVPDDCETGVYRIRHFGAHKSLFQTVHQYSGESAPFKVVNLQTVSERQLAELEARLQGALESAARRRTGGGAEPQRPDADPTATLERLQVQAAADKQQPQQQVPAAPMYSPLGLLGSLLKWSRWH